MKIALSGKGPSNTDEFDQHFGRAPYFHILEDGVWSTIDNRENANAAQGAGIQTSQRILELGVDVIITGSLGPKASKIIEGENIQVLFSEFATIKESLLHYAPKLGLSLSSDILGEQSK